MRIEWLISNTYQVTDGSTIWFQGTKEKCEEFYTIWLVRSYLILVNLGT